MKTKKVLAFLMLFAMMVPILAGCGGGEATEVPETEEEATEVATEVVTEEPGPSIADKVTVAIGADPSNLGPFVGMSMGRISVLTTLYEYLFYDNKATDTLDPYVAKSYEQTNETTFVVTIFENVYDSAGNHITAADVAWAYNTAIEANAYRPLGDVSSVTATGDYTVEFVVKDAAGAGEFDKISTECPIVSQVAYEASADQFATMPITTAAYVLTEYIPGSSLTFERNADYWQTDPSFKTVVSASNVQTAVFQIITELAQHTIALQTGSADISTSIPGSDIALFDSDPAFTVFKKMDNLTNVLAFNGSEGNPFTSLELRQAVSYAIDKQALCDAVSPGACNPSHVIGNSNFEGYLTQWETEDYYDYDLAKAQELFTASGAPADLTVTLLCQNDARTGLTAQVIQADLLQLGITVNITQVEPAVFQSDKTDPTKWDLSLDATAGGDFIFSPWQLMLDQNRYGGTTSNWFKDDQLQLLMDTASGTDTFTPENVDAAWQYIKSQDYMLGLFSYVNNIVSVSGITKVFQDSRGFVVPGACEYSDSE
jgi:ABC-type transport system substrate-binding protein